MVRAAASAAASLLLLLQPSAASAAEGASPPFRDVDLTSWRAAGYEEILLEGPVYDADRTMIAGMVVAPLLPDLTDEERATSFASTIRDLDGDGMKDLMVQVYDPAVCGDGCRTIVYRKKADGGWENVADGMSVAIVLRPGSFGFVRLDQPSRTWTAGPDGYREIPDGGPAPK